jgi:phosphate starvation-inducible protein PhoH
MKTTSLKLNFDTTQLAARIFHDLEASRRNGLHISTRDFRLAVDVARQSGEIPLNSLSTVRLVGSRNRKTLSPHTPNQLGYVKAIPSSSTS